MSTFTSLPPPTSSPTMSISINGSTISTREELPPFTNALISQATSASDANDTDTIANGSSGRDERRKGLSLTVLQGESASLHSSSSSASTSNNNNEITHIESTACTTCCIITIRTKFKVNEANEVLTSIAHVDTYNNAHDTVSHLLSKHVAFINEFHKSHSHLNDEGDVCEGGCEFGIVGGYVDSDSDVERSGGKNSSNNVDLGVFDALFSFTSSNANTANIEIKVIHQQTLIQNTLDFKPRSTSLRISLTTGVIVTGVWESPLPLNTLLPVASSDSDNGGDGSEKNINLGLSVIGGGCCNCQSRLDCNADSNVICNKINFPRNDNEDGVFILPIPDFWIRSSFGMRDRNLDVPPPSSSTKTRAGTNSKEKVIHKHACIDITPASNAEQTINTVKVTIKSKRTTARIHPSFKNYLLKPDAEILQETSTSPSCEPASFVGCMRGGLMFLIFNFMRLEGRDGVCEKLEDDRVYCWNTEYRRWVLE